MVRQAARRSFALGVAVFLGLLLAVDAPALAQTASAARNLVVQPQKPAATGQRRLALVIGNSAYESAPLENPVNDARAMARALESAGYTVMLHLNVDQRGMLAALRDFGGQLRAGGVGLFYYAGHGMQIKGRNYLIPVGADIQREDEVAYASLDAQAVLDKMEAAGNGANLMILDACRNNPFARSFRSSQQGLAQMEAPVGTLIAFATSPGAVASDGDGGNGLYTRHLLNAMSRPGGKVEDVFKQVRAAVRRESNGKQIPWEVTSLEGDLFFVDPPAPVTEPEPDPALVLDDSLWEAVKDTQDPIVVGAYLRRFPFGRHSAQAIVRLAKLEAGQEAAMLPPSPGESSSASTPAAEQPSQANPAPQPSESSEKPMGDAVRIEPDQAALPMARSYEPGDVRTISRVDLRTDSVIQNFDERIVSVDSAGIPVVGWTSLVLKPWYALLRGLFKSSDGIALSPSIDPVVWNDLPDDATMGVSFVSDVDVAGNRSANTSKATIRRKGIERVLVPAGEFEAIRIECEAETTREGRLTPDTSSTRVQRWNLSVWYVPALKTYVAAELRTPSVFFGWGGNHERLQLLIHELASRKLVTR